MSPITLSTRSGVDINPTIPILWGRRDHQSLVGTKDEHLRQVSFKDYQVLIGQIRGNSHMIMQNKDNPQIADLTLKWIDERVSTK